MKRFMLTPIVILLFINQITLSQGLIIDHTCTDLGLIPAAVIEDVKDNVKLHYAHTSHGNQIICGFEELEVMDDLYNIEQGMNHLPQVEDALCIFDGQEQFSYITPEGYWKDEGWQWTINVLNNNPEINISMWEWCTQPESYTADQMQEYLDSISSFEAMFPDVTFIYTTANAQAEGIFGYNRFVNNNIIREFCANNNKILFDFGDIDCWYEGEMNFYVYQGDTVPFEHTAYGGDVCGHTNILNTIHKGQAMWWMLAKLQGWNHNLIKLNAKVFLEGPSKGSKMLNSLNLKNYLPLSNPYSVYPWNYDGDESVIEIPTESVIDWVLVELRDAPNASSATNATMVDWQVGFLLDDGRIVSVNNDFLEFEIGISNELFVVVRHRNHLGILSASPAILSEEIYSYDFTTASNMTYGGANACKEVLPGIWGMIGGDGKSDGSVDIDDYLQSWMPQSGTKGYLSGDFNLDGQVNNLDKGDIWSENINSLEFIPQ